MTRKDKILTEKLKANGLLGKFTPESAMWNVITDCMQQYASEQEAEFMQITIGEHAEKQAEQQPPKKREPHEHDWLYCGNAFYICSDESCGAYMEL